MGEIADQLSNAGEAVADGDKDRARCLVEINAYEKEFDKWHKRAEKIQYMYHRGKRKDSDTRAKYNSFWANVNTMRPSLYAKAPSAEVDRRFKDEDPTARQASEVLERCLNFMISTTTFSDTMKHVVLDRLVSGRGTSWIRYCPQFAKAPDYEDEEVEGPTDADENQGPTTPELQISNEVGEYVDWEDLAFDYVYWGDFGHTKVRTWEEVVGVWRKAYLSRAQLVERFGEEIGHAVPLDHKLAEGDEAGVKATVYEYWCKSSKCVYWLSKDYPQLMDKKQDPLGLVNFFPCPKPLFATLANDSMVPTPDYVMYQDQALELDELTGRISSLQKALKVAGVYDASAAGIDRLLSDGYDNMLLPVDNWAAFAEKGGMKGAISFLPLDEVAKALVALYSTRDRVKQDMYEISGMSDILRGATDPNETATAQQIKSEYASVRLKEMQTDVQNFAREMLRIAGELIGELFSLETIRAMSGVKMLTQGEKQNLMTMQQLGQPVPPEAQKMLLEPTWEEVIGLLHDNKNRVFRVDIETDSTILQDVRAEQQSRLEFVQTMGQVLQSAAAMSAQMPAMVPLAAESIMFLVRSYKVGRATESTFKKVIDDIVTQSQQMQPQQQQQGENPQAQAQQQQADAQAQQVEQQGRLSEASMKIQGDLQKIQANAVADAQLEAQRQQGAEKIKVMDIIADQQKQRSDQEQAMAHEIRTTERQIAGTFREPN